MLVIQAVWPDPRLWHRAVSITRPSGERTRSNEVTLAYTVHRSSTGSQLDRVYHCGTVSHGVYHITSAHVNRQEKRNEQIRPREEIAIRPTRCEIGSRRLTLGWGLGRPSRKFQCRSLISTGGEPVDVTDFGPLKSPEKMLIRALCASSSKTRFQNRRSPTGSARRMAFQFCR
jgi:hypothetical protein